MKWALVSHNNRAQLVTTIEDYGLALTSAIKERFNQPAFLVQKKRDAKSLNEHERDLIGQVARICKIVHVNPATSSRRAFVFNR